MWGAGDNVKDGVESYDIEVSDSQYYEPCPDDQGRIHWENTPGQGFTSGGPDVTKLDHWEPRQEFVNKFDWDGCGLVAPETKCDDFPVQELGHDNKRINVNNPDEVLYEKVYGSCYPEEGF